MNRLVEPELLDHLPPTDPKAIGSRADLRRLNIIMGHAGILSRALAQPLAEASFRARPLRLVELGGGDGTFLLQLTRRLSKTGVTAGATLLDRQNLVAAETRRAFAALHCSVESVTADVFDWLERPAPFADVMLANLFLHHFQEKVLTELLRLAAARTRLFIACEPRRSLPGLACARCLRLIGCNAITRHDAAVSVRAGFRDRELSALWPTETNWRLNEQRAGTFSHCFIAQRHA